MSDCCDEDLPPPPFKGGKRKFPPENPPEKDDKKGAQSESIAISDNARKKIQGGKPVVHKKNPLQALEDEMRDHEEQLEEEHNKQWYLDEDYLVELEERINTCFSLKPLDPIFNSVLECLKKNKENPIQCRNVANMLRLKIEADRGNYVNKLKKLPPKGQGDKTAPK